MQRERVRAGVCAEPKREGSCVHMQRERVRAGVCAEPKREGSCVCAARMHACALSVYAWVRSDTFAVHAAVRGLWAENHRVACMPEGNYVRDWRNNMPQDLGSVQEFQAREQASRVAEDKFKDVQNAMNAFHTEHWRAMTEMYANPVTSPAFSMRLNLKPATTMIEFERHEYDDPRMAWWCVPPSEKGFMSDYIVRRAAFHEQNTFNQPLKQLRRLQKKLQSLAQGGAYQRGCFKKFVKDEQSYCIPMTLEDQDQWNKTMELYGAAWIKLEFMRVQLKFAYEGLIMKNPSQKTPMDARTYGLIKATEFAVDDRSEQRKIDIDWAHLYPNDPLKDWFTDFGSNLPESWWCADQMGSKMQMAMMGYHSLRIRSFASYASGLKAEYAKINTEMTEAELTMIKMQSRCHHLAQKKELLLQKIQLADEGSQKVRQESEKVIEQCDLTMNSIGEVVSYFERELFQLATLHQADEVAKAFVQDMSVWMKEGPAKMQVLEQKIQDPETNKIVRYKLNALHSQMQCMVNNGPEMLQDYCSALDKSQTIASQVIFEWNHLMREVQKMREKVLLMTSCDQQGSNEEFEDENRGCNLPEGDLDSMASSAVKSRSISRCDGKSPQSATSPASRGASPDLQGSAFISGTRKRTADLDQSIFLAGIQSTGEGVSRRGKGQCKPLEVSEFIDAKKQPAQEFESRSEFIQSLSLSFKNRALTSYRQDLMKKLAEAKRKKQYVNLMVIRDGKTNTYQIKNKNDHGIEDDEKVVELKFNNDDCDGKALEGDDSDFSDENLSADYLAAQTIWKQKEWNVGHAWPKFAGQWLSNVEYCATDNQTINQICEYFKVDKNFVYILNEELDHQWGRKWRTGGFRAGTIIILPGDQIETNLKQIVPERVLKAAEQAAKDCSAKKARRS